VTERRLGHAGDFGPVVMPLDEALDFVATETFFRIGACPDRVMKRAKSSLGVAA
jgi:hypothetical protein